MILEDIEYVEDKDSRHLSLRLLSKIFKYFISSEDFSVGFGGDVREDLPFSGKYSLFLYLDNVSFKGGRVIYKMGGAEETYIVFTPIEGGLFKVTDMGGVTEVFGSINENIKLWGEFSFNDIVELSKGLSGALRGLSESVLNDYR